MVRLPDLFKLLSFCMFIFCSKAVLAQKVSEPEQLCTQEQIVCDVDSVKWCCPSGSVCGKERERCCIGDTCCPLGETPFCLSSIRGECKTAGCCPDGKVVLEDPLKTYGPVVENKCVDPKTCAKGLISCGLDCCRAGEVCAGYECCSPEQVCNDVCCPPGQVCGADGKCTCGEDKTTCDGWCCDASNQCGENPGECCSKDICCENEELAYCFRETNGECLKWACCGANGKVTQMPTDGDVTISICVTPEFVKASGVDTTVEDTLWMGKELCGEHPVSCGNGCCGVNQTCVNGVCQCASEDTYCGSWCCDGNNTCGMKPGRCCLGDKCCENGAQAFCFKTVKGECVRWGCCPKGKAIQTVYSSLKTDTIITACFNL